MANLELNCPFCNTTLSIEESWQGQSVSCPQCGNVFEIPAQSKRKNAPATAPGNGAKHKTGKMNKLLSRFDYPWGRIYILLSKIIAALVVILALLIAGVKIYKPVGNYREKIRDWKTGIPALQQKQLIFAREYARVASLVLSGNKTFQFPKSLQTVEKELNDNLSSEEEIAESLKAMQEYQKKIETISGIMNQYFTASGAKLQHYLGPIPDFSRKPDVPERHSATILIRVGQNADFYNDDPSKQITDLFQAMNDLEARLKNSNSSSVGELAAIKDGVKFIAETLNARNKYRIVTGASFAEPSKSSDGPRVQEETLLLARILYNIKRLCDWEISTPRIFTWKISLLHAELHNDLISHQVKLRTIKAELKNEMSSAIKAALMTILSGIIAAFLILVFSDYLEAHFDGAVAVKTIAQKMHIFLLCLGLALFLTGCGESPESLFERDKASLQQSVITEILALQMDLNKGALFFRGADADLIILAGGKPVAEKLFSDSELTAFSRLYTVVKLKLEPAGIQQIGSCETDKNGVLKATFTLNYALKIGRSFGDGVHGFRVHSFRPSNSQQNWIEDQIRRMPGHSLDYYVAAAQISIKETESISETYTAVWNRNLKQWQLKTAATFTPPAELRPTDGATLETTLHQSGFKKMPITYRGKSWTLWLRESDFVEADNIFRKGLIKSNGRWKDAETIAQEKNLENAYNEWRRRRTTSLQVFEKLLKSLNDNPRAENRAQIAARAETEFLRVFVSYKTKVSEQNLASLKSYLHEVESNSLYKVLDCKKLKNTLTEKIRKMSEALENQADSQD